MDAEKKLRPRQESDDGKGRRGAPQSSCVKAQARTLTHPGPPQARGYRAKAGERVLHHRNISARNVDRISSASHLH
jgi:hypothetical protein